MSEIYIIEDLFMCSMHETKSFRLEYKPIGYVDSLETACKIVEESGFSYNPYHPLNGDKIPNKKWTIMRKLE